MDFLCNTVNVVTHFSSFFLLHSHCRDKPNLLFFGCVCFFICFLVIFCLLHTLCRNQAPTTCVKPALLLFLTSRHTHLRTSINHRCSWSPGSGVFLSLLLLIWERNWGGTGAELQEVRAGNWVTILAAGGILTTEGSLGFMGFCCDIWRNRL